MNQGIVTKVVRDKKYCIIDDKYYCSFGTFGREPAEGDSVTYEIEIIDENKKNAKNVKFNKNIYVEYYKDFKSSYFNEFDCLSEKFILEYPFFFAKLFQVNSSQNSPTQVRKYYDKCKSIEIIFKHVKNFEYVKSELLQLIPIINNANSKGHISEEFKKFLETNLKEATKSPKHFTEGFLKHFQSLLGYYKTQ